MQVLLEYCYIYEWKVHDRRIEIISFVVILIVPKNYLTDAFALNWMSTFLDSTIAQSMNARSYLTTVRKVNSVG